MSVARAERHDASRPIVSNVMNVVSLRGAVAPLVVLTALFSACGEGVLLGPDARQGIEGIALLGPMCPVQSLQHPCPDQPHQAAVVVRDAGGGFVTSFETGEDGMFRVGLVPGRYTLDPESGDPFPAASEQVVDVVAGRYTEVVLAFDTGIR